MKAIERPKIWVEQFQQKLYLASKAGETRRFGLLYDKVYRMEVLQQAWKRVKRNRGSAGIDGKSIKKIERDIGVEIFLAEIHEELKSGQYTASNIRRVYIPKGVNGKRPLGIPTVKDRVVQMAVKLIIEPLFEADFLDCSYGFRPRRSNTQAVKMAHGNSNWSKWVVDVDLKSYFDTIPHDKLKALIRKRVGDKYVLALIHQWLKAGIMEEGKVRKPTDGTPQGGVLSPLLSNIYLNEIDKLWNDNPTVEIVRYADDMVLFCRTEKQANYVLNKLRGQLEELGLTLNEEKSKIVHAREGFDFLGYTIKEAYSYKCGKLVRIKFPRSKSEKNMRQKIKDAIKSTPLGTDLLEVITMLNRKLSGWANYFKIGNSYKQALRLSGYVCSQLRLYWRRCKHRKEISGYRIWKNSYFYGKGLYYVPNLLSR
jgi:RNA-directed DNA polymerase